MKRILVAAVLGTFAIYIWGWISWAVLPWHNTTMPELPNEDAVIGVLQSSITQTGVYQFPGKMKTDEAAWLEKFRRGPSGTLFYTAGGKNPMAADIFAVGFVLAFIQALLAAWLLSAAASKMAGYAKRVIFVTLLGVFAALVSHISAAHWMFFPAGYSHVMAIDLVVTWFLAGLVLAWRIKPEAAAA